LKNWPIFLKKYVRTARSQTQLFMFPTVLLSKSSPKPKKNNWGPFIKRLEPISRAPLKTIFNFFPTLARHHGRRPPLPAVRQAHPACGRVRPRHIRSSVILLLNHQGLVHPRLHQVKLYGRRGAEPLTANDSGQKAILGTGKIAFWPNKGQAPKYFNEQNLIKKYLFL
jgi:hypothetical protein